jgi:mono/diheme cytochrome c family protein
MDQGAHLRTCDRCGRESGECKDRVVYTAWHHQAGRTAEPRRHIFWICPRCLNLRERGSELGQALLVFALIAFGSWLLNFPAVFWRWPQTAPRGHGALGAELILGVMAVGTIMWAALNFKRWLRNKALDALPAAEAPGWTPQEITPEKYEEWLRAPEALADLGAAGAAVPFEPGRCAVCHGGLEDSAARVVLRTGREIASQVTDVRRQGNSIMTTSLKTYGDIEDFEARVCPGCWIDRRRNLRRTAALFAGLFPVLLVAVLIGFISGIKDAFLGLGLTALVLVGGLSFYAVMLKGFQGRHPMAILEKRITGLRNRGRAKSDIIVVSTTWPPPRKRYFE